MSYKKVLTDAHDEPSLVIVERKDGVPKVSGSVVSLDADGATIKTTEGEEVYIEFASIRGVTCNGWDMEVLVGGG